MSENEITQVTDPAADAAAPVEETPIVIEKAKPIESRFLYVDVSALRAKQLRRGARPRLDEAHLASLRVQPHKPERVAMEEVKSHLVLWDIAPPKPTE